MKLKVKLVGVVIAALLCIFVMIIGVLAASQGTVNIGGTVSFVAEDVHAVVKGKISGVKESGDEIKLSDLNYSAKTEPTKEELDTWKNKNLTFKDKKNKIIIEITIENLNKERSIYIDVTGNTGTSNNLTKTLIHQDKEYKSGDIIELKPRTDTEESITSFILEMEIANTNYSVNNVEFDYVLTLNNYLNSNDSKTKYNVNCEFVSADMTYSSLVKVTNSEIEGENVYKVTMDGDVCAYVSSNVDLLVPVEEGNLEIKIYISFGLEVTIKINNETIDASFSEEYYTVYTINTTISNDTLITVEGELFPLM